MGIPMLKIRRSRDRLIFNMGIPILVRRHLYIETTPSCQPDVERWQCMPQTFKWLHECCTFSSEHKIPGIHDLLWPTLTTHAVVLVKSDQVQLAGWVRPIFSGHVWVHLWSDLSEVSHFSRHRSWNIWWRYWKLRIAHNTCFLWFLMSYSW